MVSLNLILLAIGKLFGVGLLGFVGVRLRLLRTSVLLVLSRFVIYLALPCLVVDTYARVLDPSVVTTLVLCFGAGTILIGGSLLIAFGCSLMLPGGGAEDRGLFVSLSSMQNSGYLPIPLVVELLPEHLRAEGLLYTFMYIFVMSLIFWSYGIRLISGGGADRFRDHLRRAVNPPMISLALGFVFLVPSVKAAYADLAVAPAFVGILGQSTIPAVLLILGGSLAATGVRGRARNAEVFGSAFLKLLVIPGCAIIGLKLLPPGEVFGFALLLQACMPAATNHIVIVQEYGGNQALTSRALLVHYLGASLSVPLFLAFF